MHYKFVKKWEYLTKAIALIGPVQGVVTGSVVHWIQERSNSDSGGCQLHSNPKLNCPKLDFI